MNNDAHWKHEENLVRWILEHYGLHDVRARFMILDEEECLAVNARPVGVGDPPPPPTRRLTLRAFDAFFQYRFPVRLDFCHLRQREARAIQAAKLIGDFGSTRLYRDCTYALEHAEPHRATGVVYHWPYLRDVGKSIVVHDALPVDPSVPGTHLVWTDENGESRVVETLGVMVRSLDARRPPHEWKSAAKRPGFDSPLR